MGPQQGPHHRSVVRANRRTAEPIDSAQANDLAFEFLTELLTLDPNREALRKQLGQREHNGQWLSAFEYGMARRGLEWHSTYGWIPVGQEARYKAGEIFDANRRRWMDAEAADRAHSTLDRPWVIRTEHILINCTAPLAVGVEAADKLERFYRQIFATYSGFFTQGRNDYRLILGLAEHPPLQVWIYRDKAQYLQALPSAPEWSAGLFVPRDDVSHFFGKVDSTMYHEFTHQIFDVFANGNDSLPWVTEGVAVYTELPRFDDQGRLQVGDASRSTRVRAYRRSFLNGTAVTGTAHGLRLALVECRGRARAQLQCRRCGRILLHGSR